MQREKSMRLNWNKFVLISLILIGVVSLFTAEGNCTDSTRMLNQHNQQHKRQYIERQYPTPNFDKEAVNEVEGVILHHTAEPTVEKSLAILTSPKKGVSTHVVIDTDGTRYILAKPTVVTYHAGLSVLNGREGCNYFTIGIEFQGNTLEAPLTEDQIASAIEYLKPIIEEYNIPVGNIVTHEMVRKAYKRKHPQKRCYDKVDITQVEYKRVINALKRAIKEIKN